MCATGNKTHRHQVQKLQNSAVNITLDGAAKHEHATPFLIELGRLKIKEKVMLKLRIVKHSVTRSPQNAIYHMPVVSKTSIINTSQQQQQQLYVRKYNTCTPIEWPSAPPPLLKDAHSLYTFKNQSFLHLFSSSSERHVFFINLVLPCLRPCCVHRRHYASHFYRILFLIFIVTCIYLQNEAKVTYSFLYSYFTMIY